MRTRRVLGPINDLSPAIDFSEPAHEREAVTQVTGCPRCGSMCSFLDDCAVCLGHVPCARCLFGPRVDTDEIHATFAPAA